MIWHYLLVIGLTLGYPPLMWWGIPWVAERIDRTDSEREMAGLRVPDTLEAEPYGDDWMGLT